jgi:hypothetical protein
MKKQTITKEELRIDKDIPLPPKKNGPTSRYAIIPAKKMYPGHSVLFPTSDKKEKLHIRRYLSKTMKDYRYAFVCLDWERGVRIFCVKKEGQETAKQRHTGLDTTFRKDGRPYTRGPYKKRKDAGIPKGTKKKKTVKKQAKKKVIVKEANNESQAK